MWAIKETDAFTSGETQHWRITMDAEQETEVAGESTGEEAEAVVAAAEDGDDKAEAETGAPESTESADAIRKGEIKGLPEEAQQAVNRRIGKVVAREKAAIERAEAAEAELATAKGNLEGGVPELAKRLGLSADLVTKDEAQVVEESRKLRAQRDWCREHDGRDYEGDGTAGDPSVTAATIRKELIRIENRLDEIGPRAREIQDRADKQAREIWAAGKAALKAKSQATTPPAGSRQIVKPPAIPTGSATPKAPTSAKKSKGTFDQGEFKKEGGGMAALEKQFEKLYG
jgi:hypothetical protein